MKAEALGRANVASAESGKSDASFLRAEAIKAEQMRSRSRAASVMRPVLQRALLL